MNNDIVTGGAARGLTGNTLVDVIGVIFGMNGLFDIRAASCIEEASGRPRVHPLAQLSTVGRSLIENAIRTMGFAIGASFGGGIAGILSNALGAALQSASGMFVGIAIIGLTAGFILYYILPFLPFIYFFFAVGSWVKSIFEAMVGVPLWALAHLHIDGDGLSGRAAKGGYFLILEIFLRPIVIVFGLIGSMAIFAAMATMLNLVFDLVVVNITGALPTDPASGSTIGAGTVENFRRGVIDQFFFTIMYAVLLYMMATASFKMIDNVPNGIMRWMSPGVSTFNDNKSDPTANLAAYASMATTQFAQPIMQNATNAVGGAARGLAGALRARGDANGGG
jgi:conjugal transfer/type IV secretion protein DotA/TraY